MKNASVAESSHPVIVRARASAIHLSMSLRLLGTLVSSPFLTNDTLSVVGFLWVLATLTFPLQTMLLYKVGWNYSFYYKP